MHENKSLSYRYNRKFIPCHTNQCVISAFANVTGQTSRKIYNLAEKILDDLHLKGLQGGGKKGYSEKVISILADTLGFEFVDLYDIRKLPKKGKIVVDRPDHMFAVIDGKVYDHSPYEDYNSLLINGYYRLKRKRNSEEYRRGFRDATLMI